MIHLPIVVLLFAVQSLTQFYTVIFNGRLECFIGGEKKLDKLFIGLKSYLYLAFVFSIKQNELENIRRKL